MPVVAQCSGEAVWTSACPVHANVGYAGFGADLHNTNAPMTEAKSSLNLAAKPSFTLGLSWPLLIALVAALSVLGSSRIHVLGDPDTYLHIAAGRWMLANGTVPTADPFSHSMLGTAWIAHEWLSELVISGTYQSFGWAGLGGLMALVFAGTLAYLMRFLLDRMEPIHALLFTSYAACMLAGHLLARPHVLAWPLLAVWVGSLVNASEQDRAPPWWLIPMMALWANLHGGFMLGIALACGLALDATVSKAPGQRRACAWVWGRFIALAVVAAMVTPSHWHGLLFPFQVVNMSEALDMIGEWASPNFHQPQLLEIWLLLALGLACSGRLRLPWVRLLLVLALTHLALKYQRNISILGLVAPFLMASPLARQWRAISRTGRDVESMDRVFQALSAPAQLRAMVGTALLASLSMALASQSDRFVPESNITPEAAMQAARRAGVSGAVFNDYQYGGYLIFKGTPVFIDGRADMYGDALMKRHLAATTLDEPQALPKLLDDYHIGWTLLHPGTPAVALLDRLPGWRRVYADEVAVVHMREPDGQR